jgi:hypothetical protein
MADSSIPKTRFSGPRYLYPVGLEHSGHHLWQRLLPRFSATSGVSSALHPIERRGCARQRWWGSDPGARSWFALENVPNPCPFARADDAAKVVATLKRAFEEDVAQRRTSLYNIKSCSFPCGPGSFPDVTLVARAAEAAGVDLRLVVMTRDPTEIVHGCGLGCGFTELRVRQMLHACRQLDAQLRKLHPAFYQCFDYHAYPLVSTAQRDHVMGARPNSTRGHSEATGAGGGLHAKEVSRFKLDALLRDRWRPTSRANLSKLSLHKSGAHRMPEWAELMRCAAELPTCAEATRARISGSRDAERPPDGLIEQLIARERALVRKLAARPPEAQLLLSTDALVQARRAGFGLG